jgi:hypothetical protein
LMQRGNFARNPWVGRLDRKFQNCRPRGGQQDCRRKGRIGVSILSD